MKWGRIRGGKTGTSKGWRDKIPEGKIGEEEEKWGKEWEGMKEAYWSGTVEMREKMKSLYRFEVD